MKPDALMKLCLSAVLCVTMVGCQMDRGPSPTQLAQAHYQRGDYAKAQTAAARAAATAGGSQRYLANYMAGMSAYRLNNFAQAERYLRIAANSKDQAMAADAQSTVGLIYSRQGRYAQAADALLRSARNHTGEDRAQAYLYAGIAQQKLGRWPQARTSLLLARSSTRDAQLAQRVNTQLAVTGYTIQVGAFSSRTNADKAAAGYTPRASRAKVGLVRVVPASRAGRRGVNLVQVGRFATFNAASEGRRRLGDTSALVVPLKP
jgi:tetratricopeptide (TPR) repeat protein